MNETNRQLMSSPSRGSVGVVDGGWIREAEGAWFEVDVGGNGCIGIDGVKMFVLHYLIETKTHPERNMVSRLTANLQADMLGNKQHNNNNHFSRRNQSLNSSAVSSPRRSPYAQPTLSNFHPPRLNPAFTLLTLSKFKRYCLSQGLTRQDLHSIRLGLARLKSTLLAGGQRHPVFDVLDVGPTEPITHFANYLVTHIPPEPEWLNKDAPEEEMALELLCRYRGVEEVMMEEVRRDGRLGFTFGVVCKWWEMHKEQIRMARRRVEEMEEMEGGGKGDEEEKGKASVGGSAFLPIRTWRDEVQDVRVYRVKEGFVDDDGTGANPEGSRRWEEGSEDSEVADAWRSALFNRAGDEARKAQKKARNKVKGEGIEPGYTKGTQQWRRRRLDRIG